MWPHRVKAVPAVVAVACLVTCSAPEHQAREAPRSRMVLHVASLRPVVIGRAAWHADEKAVPRKPLYDDSVRAVFIHHTDNPNDYDCAADVPAMLQAMEDRHIHDLKWDDLGYNFVVDRCGHIYEGRAGGVDRAVRGAHAEGFNAHTVGIAALGSFGPGQRVPHAMLQAIAAIAAWKLAPGEDPGGRVRLVSSNSESRFPKGKTVELNVVSGHRDVFETTCPGEALYDELPWIRRTAAELRRHATWAG
ncbi:N-acetylmuramoyl-L-alanine amidase [Actinacidiphila sp. ITFR-21]|uniref:N-acetylmuramoyl-L-alanine amidase n=1 Tax=Actinacidiphila sp. ITFR-21 TaxID=3075199 RepID=UPI00288A3476|nr:N-acetylmuramoyl-L-alanine amidase [Streptomyces sp. ITFR-21]WNI16803.1 N-acetylmuramoyl-L-alanine amidase [Streptomyces sp. ITFR-21]